MILATAALLVPILIAAALRALLAAIAVWATLRLLRIANVVIQKAAWGLILVASLAMPFVSGFVPNWQGLPSGAAIRLPSLAAVQMQSPPTTTRTTAQSNSTAGASFSPEIAFDSGLNSGALRSANRSGFRAAAASTRMRSHQSAPSASPSPAIPPINTAKTAATTNRMAKPTRASHSRLIAAALAIYLVVCAALLLRLVLGVGSAFGIWMTAERVTALPAGAAISLARLRSSTRVASPVNIGSAILLPAGYREWDEEKLRIVLAHECSHIRQHDFYLQILAGLYACVFWLSPLGWWLKRKLYELGEAISDRAGLEQAGSRTSYAQLLLEFAALPRPTLTGVAMARTNHLSQRIERLLNESHFRQAFTGGGRRTLLAVGIVPLALFAATALVRVESATAATQAPAASAPAGQSTPEQVTNQAPAPPSAPAATPETHPAPAPETAPTQPAPPSPKAAPAPPPAPPSLFLQKGPVPVAPGAALAPQPPAGLVPRYSSGFYAAPFDTVPEQLEADSMRLYAVPDRLEADSMRLAQKAELAADMMVAQAQQFAQSANCFANGGDPYALIQSDGRVVRPDFCLFTPLTRLIAIEKVRKITHGSAALLFEHDGKTYIVDDPSVVAQIQAMDKPIADLRSQMQALGKQMRDLGEQQRDLGKRMRETAVPTPDVSKQIADLNAAAASLKAKEGGTISQQELADLQREIAKIQGQLGALQGKIGAQEDDLGGQMGKLGGQMGQLGGQMGQLGAKMSELVRENQEKVKGIIADSLSNGKAKPVE